MTKNQGERWGGNTFYNIGINLNVLRSGHYFLFNSKTLKYSSKFFKVQFCFCFSHSCYKNLVLWVESPAHCLISQDHITAYGSYTSFLLPLRHMSILRLESTSLSHCYFSSSHSLVKPQITK